MSGLTHTFKCKLTVPPARAFAALTHADELKRWFAEHAEVEPRVGGAYRFWGKHSYGVRTRADADQRLVRFEPGREVAFTWTVHAKTSEVSLTIEPDGDGTVLNGRHEFAESPDVGRAKELVDDLWRLQCGNLQTHLKGGRVLRPDFTDPSPEIRLSIDIDAPRERVFDALMNPELLNKWVASAAVVEPRVGGRYSFGWAYPMGGVTVEGGPTRILELVENEKLVVDWPDWRGDATVPTQRITWLLETVGRQTRVTMIHSGFVRAADISDYPFGWDAFAGRLKLVAEGKDVPAMEGGCG